ncbi:hypothetical protein [Aurantimonas sp. VKM B-3413]|uniref:hypothetical protein n=1 Tax=Aurantimonas sp. VKM B-3413 TaxID=2779401 RepID=UPI001E42F2A7|nr:hypothetical protein [Aurantimonas sp. VKM B-3413]MCB8838520.1 hypothetical protein [Aurantimonas sp. VKM B-3413]
MNRQLLLSTGLALALALGPVASLAQTTPSPDKAETPAAEAAPAMAAEPAAPADQIAPQATQAPASDTAPAGQAEATGKTAEAGSSATDIASVVEGLTPMVQDVQIVGPWTNGDRQGVWRTVIAQPSGENAKSHFFVQQIETKGTDYTVLSTTEITEISKVDGAILGYRADEPSDVDPNSLMLFFEIVPTGAELSETYELRFHPGQPYDFGPSTN